MREVLEHMSIAQLIDTILINPTVHIAPSYRDTGLSATYTFQPLSNLVYTRDQQARGQGFRVWGSVPQFLCMRDQQALNFLSDWFVQ